MHVVIGHMQKYANTYPHKVIQVPLVIGESTNDWLSNWVTQYETQYTHRNTTNAEWTDKRIPTV